MSATTAVLAGRRAAEALMVDACTITRQTGQTTDPATMVVTPVTTVVYTGKCRVQFSSATGVMDRPNEVGGAAQYLQHSILQLPAPVTGVASDDLVTMDASPQSPDLVGRTLHVRALGHKTHATMARYEITEVTG